MRRRQAGSTRAACLVLAAVALVLVPSAGAGIAGEISYRLASVEEVDVEASLELTGEVAGDLRERADDDGDGEVSSLEAAGAEIVLDGRLEGETGAYTLDGNRYTNERVSVGSDGLAGPVDQDAGLELEITAEARASAGQRPHTFAVHGLPVELTETDEVVHEVRVPGGHRIAEAEGFALVEDCNARTEPGQANASLAFEAREGACERPVPTGGSLPALLAALVAAFSVSRRRSGRP